MSFTRPFFILLILHFISEQFKPELNYLRKYLSVKNYLSLVKFPHTIFALPFALLGYFIGVQVTGLLSVKILCLVILCMIFARSAAMGFNRWADTDIDSLNPRTQTREIPSGTISRENALLFVMINVVGFCISTFFINQLAFYLSPIAIFVILFYSYTKRFTSLCHLVLGVGLGLAPLGAYIAVTGQFHTIPILYGLAVLFWVSGFDIIYSLQDDEFDKDNALNSIPVRFGRKRALWISTGLHLFSAILIVWAGYLLYTELPGIWWLHVIAVVIFVGLLFYQHTIVSENDLSRVDLAFFSTNGYASLIFCSLVILDFYV